MSIRHFGVTWAESEFSAKNIEKYGDEGIHRVLEIVDEGRQDLIVGNMFYSRRIPGEIANLPKDSELQRKVERNMRERLRYVFPYLRRRQYPTYMILNHEALDIYEGRRVWTEDVYYQAFGTDLFVATGEIALEEAEQAGLKPGRDITFLYGGLTSLSLGPLLDFFLDVFTDAKRQLTAKMGVPYEQAPFGISSEGHEVQKGSVRGHEPVPSQRQMLEAFTTTTREGPLYVVEVELQNGSAEQVGQFYSDLAIAAHSAGVQGVAIWHGLRDCNVQPEPGWCNPEGMLFDANRNPTTVYNTLLSTLNSIG